MLNYKELKKLTAMCRKCGIKHFKGPDFEITLTEDAPFVPRKSSKTQEVVSVQQDNIPNDLLTQEQLLQWSLPDDIESVES